MPFRDLATYGSEDINIYLCTGNIVLTSVRLTSLVQLDLIVSILLNIILDTAC